MPTPTPADQLREAASLLRDKATAAIHEGRTTWSTGNTLASRSPVVLDDPEQPSVLIETYAARLERVNSYLALLGPATGIAVADWLDREAALWNAVETTAAEHGPKGLKVTVGLSTHTEALAVARQILGTTTDTTVAAPVTEAAPVAVIHACPGPDDNGTSPCCHRPPFEVRSERITRDPALVTCPGAPATEEPTR
ncbi:hypothetical protein [Lysinibacillus sp. NPDC056185]|uniref:hypothetical protein n=1 Tax=Lysinibacillus sp. NPDC056185 TaxID=3345739 RepID=UPI0039F12D18